MRTIGKHWPRSAPKGDYTAMCAQCGVPHRRSELRRQPKSGLLLCRTDFEAGPAVLSEANARDAEALAQRRFRPPDGGFTGER